MYRAKTAKIPELRFGCWRSATLPPFNVTR